MLPHAFPLRDCRKEGKLEILNAPGRNNNISINEDKTKAFIDEIY